MEPKFQTSFIPKKPISGSSDKAVVVYDTNIFTLSATLIFMVTILLFGGLFLYKTLLLKQIKEADTAVNQARSAIQPEKIQDIFDANSRIAASLGLLERHQSMSKFLVLLGEITLNRIQFNDLSYSTRDGVPLVLLNGAAASYGTLAYQQKVLRENESIKNPTFTNISLSDEGKINFKFSAVLSEDLVSFKRSVELTEEE